MGGREKMYLCFCLRSITDAVNIKKKHRHTLNPLCLFNDAIVNYILVAFVIRW